MQGDHSFFSRKHKNIRILEGELITGVLFTSENKRRN